MSWGHARSITLFVMFGRNLPWLMIIGPNWRFVTGSGVVASFNKHP
jgi:hypothetical protein